MRRAAVVAALLGFVAAGSPSVGAAPIAETTVAEDALAVTVRIEAETLLEIARDGSIVRVRSNANPPEFTSRISCVYTFSSGPCGLTRGILDQLSTLPLRRTTTYGTVYP